VLFICTVIMYLRVNVKNRGTYTCASPLYLRGTKVIEYDLSIVQCLPEWVWIVTGVGAGKYLFRTQISVVPLQLVILLPYYNF